MKFSERIGAREPPRSGLEEASQNLRIALWNAMHPTLFPGDEFARSVVQATARMIWNHLGYRTDEVPLRVYQIREAVSAPWFKSDWPEFFDLVEFSAQLLSQLRGTPVYETLNDVLEQQGCAYRFIGQDLAPLTNPAEVAEVQRAAESAIPAVAAHIREALKLLPPNPDASPRNSVKESISAVEAALKVLSGNSSATLAAGLAAFEAKYGEMHPALRAGLVKLYGYTSDEDGVRHALVDEQADVTVDDARFMLVTCSAFANYLVALSAAHSK